ncbi:adenosine deaminase [Rhipicephalus sanguineus]|uniref:adenosine deaminase n=1 Tax=Rhipicephalus sanguineus TaxID=34632 RepID=UPI0018955422|nr:adenosine deaminase [Rhipicephalus sanguineus]
MGLPKFKIMLHSHIEGHLRHTTIWELAQAKNIDLGYSSLQDIIMKTQPERGSTLQNYLKEMPKFLRVVAGDRAALERVAFEVGEDQANQGVLYSEMRLFPHLMASQHTLLKLSEGPHSVRTAADAIDAVLEGFRRAEREHGIMLRLVLACFRDKPEWAEEVVSLCHEYRDKGVVGMDVCGVFAPKRTETEGEEILHPDVIKAFQRAATLGVHRTAHAGEAGPASNVSRAIEELRTERIGHGYAAMREGGAPLQLALDRGIHFEVCPNSSYLTGAVSPGERHPMLCLRDHCASYSLNTDDPTITHTRISDEYQLALKLGFRPDDILESNRAAIEASFLSPEEKRELRNKFERLNASSSSSCCFYDSSPRKSVKNGDVSPNQLGPKSVVFSH